MTMQNESVQAAQAATSSMTNQQQACATEFMKQAALAANATMGTSASTSFTPLQYPQQGDFPYNYTNGNNINGLTYNYVSGTISPSSIDPSVLQLGAAGSFPNAYQQLLDQVVFQLSEADSARLQTAQNQASAQATSIVSMYNSIYGAPTQAQYDAATNNPAIAGSFTANNEIDYIMQYAVGWVWAGKPTKGYTLTQMQQAPSLTSLLTAVPPTGMQILGLVPQYLAALGPAAQILDQQSLANWTIASLKNNTANPGVANGGIQLYNNQAAQPAGSYALGYTLGPSPAAILQSISSSKQAATFSFSASASSAGQYNVQYQGGTGFSVGSLIKLSVGTSFQGEVGSIQGAGSSMTVQVSYPGLTKISVAPVAWNGASNESGINATTGWWYEALLYQAFASYKAGASAPTGVSFGPGGPTPVIGAAGTLGTPAAILISNYPTLTVSFSNGSYSQFSQWLKTQTSMSVKLFGLFTVGQASVDTYTASAQQGSSDSSFTLTLTPPPPAGVSVAPPQETLPVLGVATTWVGLSPT
jgi:hypothetical protein